MTSQNKKRQKLRNAEYYGVQSLLDNLYADSKSGKIFTKLVEQITLPQNVELAYRNLKKNSGSKTAGVDDKTIDDLAGLTNEQITDYVRQRLRYYKPHRVRRVEIPKKNGKMRPLGIPTIYDRLIQQCILQILEPICEAKFYPHSYGFRPNKCCEHAVARAYKLAQNHKLRHVVDMDIKGFFDNVNHGKLLKQMWALGLRDKKLICIISQMLKAEIVGIGVPTKGTPQGGILSPLLANIVLNELDWWIASQWEIFPTKHQYESKVMRNGNSGENHGNRYAAQRNSNLKECFIVRYADDFKIFCRSKNEAERIFQATTQWLKERLFLEISPEKSHVVNLRKGYSEFLGIQFKLIAKGKEKDGSPKYVIQSHICEAAIEKVAERMHMSVSNLAHCSDRREQHVVIDNINMYVFGVHQYYQMATHIVRDLNPINRSVLSRLDHNKNLKCLLTKQGEAKLPKYVVQKYSTSKCIRYITGRTLIPIGFVKTKPPMFPKRGVNKYTAKGRALIHDDLRTINISILHYLMNNPNRNRSIEFNDNRLALYCAQNGKCAITGKILEIGDMHCHHVLPLHAGGTDKYHNLKIVCVDVHKLIHAVDKNTIGGLLGKVKLTAYQLKRLNHLRTIAGNQEIQAQMA
ncbi:group II intron reverse transcriptase/maturase [Bengtsoniella intestinalis]